MRVEGAAEDVVFRVCGLVERVLALMEICGGDVHSEVRFVRLTIIVWGMLVFTYSTAPSSSSIVTSAEFVVAGALFRQVT